MVKVHLPGCVPNDIKLKMQLKSDELRSSLITIIDHELNNLVNKKTKEYRNNRDKYDQMAVDKAKEIIGFDPSERINHLEELGNILRDLPSCESVDDFNNRLSEIKTKNVKAVIDELDLHKIVPEYKRPTKAKVTNPMPYKEVDIVAEE